MSTIPCKECVSLAICRHKRYIPMITKCSILGNLIDDLECKEDFLLELEKVMKPTKWKTIDYGDYEDGKNSLASGLRVRVTPPYSGESQ